MVNVVRVKFSENGRSYFFDPVGKQYTSGDRVLVETVRGTEIGIIDGPNIDVEDEEVVRPLRTILRDASRSDLDLSNLNTERNRAALEVAKAKAIEYNVPMKFIAAEHSFDGGKVTLYFTADGRVDFRDLLKELRQHIHYSIELLQVGVRDETRMLGGFGICGKEYCCKQFLRSFHPVSIKMAKNQGLSLNPAKISGACGRLMCCLQYEDAAYKELVAKAPKVDAFVETPGGKGTVISVNLLRGTAKIRLEDGNDTQLKTMSFDELDVLGGKAKRAEYQAAKAEGRLTEAGFTDTAKKPIPSRPAPAKPHISKPAPARPAPPPVKSRSPQPFPADRNKKRD